MTNERLDFLGTLIVLAVAFLLPIFFIPFIYVPFQDTKILLLAVGVFVPVLIWTVARLRSNSIAIPKEKFILPLIALPVITLVVSLFSGNIFHSLVGNGIDIDTTLMIFILTLGFGVGVYLFDSRDKVVRFYIVLIASALILFLYQIAKLIFGGDFLSFNNILTGVTSNLIGKWNDVAIFAGLITLLSVITLDILRPKGNLKVIFYTSLILSLIMLVIVNFPLVWLILGFISFLLFVRSFVRNKFFADKKEVNESINFHFGDISKFTLLILSVSILFIFAGPAFGKFINTQFGIFQIEARPSWQSTILIAEKVYSRDIFLGAGPNNFKEEWLLNKPNGINSTSFWNTDFLFGVGIIPTLFITGGLFGVFAWILFLALFFWSGIRMFIRLDIKPFDYYLSTSSFISAVFLWLLSIFYIPQITLFFFAFVFSGIFLSTQIQSGVVKQKIFEFNKNLKINFVGIVLLFVLLIVASTGLYVSIQKFVSAMYIQRAGVQINIDGNIQAAEKSLNLALAFNKNDLVYRSISSISLIKLTDLVNKKKNTTEIQQQFNKILSSAKASSHSAIAVNNKNYQNWVALGKVYETLIQLNDKSAYNNARSSYEKALSLNPKNPILSLNLARIDVLNGDNKAARKQIANTLSIKNDYTNAIFLLSKIEINEGNVSDAISSIEVATFLTPKDPLVFFQLGILKYSEKDYKGAIVAFNRALLLDSQYSNARYFLGLSYYQSGRIQDAIDQFNLVKDLNPNNTEINSIIWNLSNGLAPFGNFTPKTDPLKESLPVEE